MLTLAALAISFSPASAFLGSNAMSARPALRSFSGCAGQRLPARAPTPCGLVRMPAADEEPRQPLRRFARALRSRVPTGRAARPWRLTLPALAVMLFRCSAAIASGGMAVPDGPVVPLSRGALMARLALWAVLFSTAAVLAGAETAITTLWPWKAKKLAEEEGESSPFAGLQDDITTVLTTGLVGVTLCMVWGTALATDIAIQVFGKRGVGLATVALTMVTLVLGEIVPKSIAVANAEGVARATLPLINFLNVVLYPVTWSMSLVNVFLLKACGLSTSEDTATAVSQPELRMILTGAKQSGAVELYEQDMIEGVLDMQTTQVQQIVTPRVEIEAIAKAATLADLLDLSLNVKYSRIPVYNETVDEIIGVVLTRELLEVAAFKSRQELAQIQVAAIMEETAFCPETMTAMNALKQMRRERLHMMVVVDEFGGTTGLVTLEDILETLVGEIYDEDDDEEVEEDGTSIVQQEDGSFLIEGTADLDLVCDKLNFTLPEETLAEFATISGYLCQQAGEIPEIDDTILVGGLRFDVREADERRLLSVRARILEGGAGAGGDDAKGSRGDKARVEKARDEKHTGQQ
tara:strand:- start:750 stop:2486 length:1737 start_codon:yes stop_codon:yes gene_type:complete